MPKTIKLDAVRKACAAGNKTACKLTLRFSSAIFGAAHISFASVDMEDENPNRMPFTGVLLIVDAPSTKPPHGSRGHRILVPRAVAKKRLSGLVGMGLNYEPNLESHAPRRKVGVITEVWLSGDEVKVKGFVYAKDFPEVKQDFKQGRLGMSMELANVYVKDEHADVWYLEDFHFTGATVLKKEAAAYYQTALAAKAAKRSSREAVQGEDSMAELKKKKAVNASGETDVTRLIAGLTKSFREANAPIVEVLKAQGETLSSLRDEITEQHELLQISAAASRDEDEDEVELDAAGEDEDEDDDIDAAFQRGGGDPSDPSDPSDASDEDASDVDAMEDLEEEAVEEEPGEVGSKRGDKNKGNKTTVTDPPKQGAKVPGNIAKKRLASAAEKKMKKPFPGLKSQAAQIQAAGFIGDLKAQVRQLRAAGQKRDEQFAKLTSKYDKLHNRYESMEAQVARYAEIEGSRSHLSSDLVNIAAKSNLDLNELHASGQKLTVGQVDELFENSGLGLDPTQRMTLKNKMLESGLMEQGEVKRQLMQ